MKIGFIGAGSVAQKYARYFVHHGHEVTLSNSRGADSLKEVVQSLGPHAKAGTVIEAAEQELVVLAVRWEHAQEALAKVPEWKGRILVDATNRLPSAATKERGASEVIASFAPGARLVKGLNTLVVNWIPEPALHQQKLVLFISGDDVEAKQTLSRVLDGSGFTPVDLGGLREGGRLQEFGQALSGLHLNLIKKMNS